jgi:hypothetical protein
MKWFLLALLLVAARSSDVRDTHDRLAVQI